MKLLKQKRKIRAQQDENPLLHLDEPRALTKEEVAKTRVRAEAGEKIEIEFYPTENLVRDELLASRLAKATSASERKLIQNEIKTLKIEPELLRIPQKTILANGNPEALEAELALLSEEGAKVMSIRTASPMLQKEFVALHNNGMQLAIWGVMFTIVDLSAIYDTIRDSN